MKACSLALLIAVITFTIFSFLPPQSNQSSLVAAQQPKLRIMNWNIGPIYVGTGVPKNDAEAQQMIKEQTARMHRLADVIKNNQVEVVFFQQFTNLDPDLRRKVKIKQLDVLLRRLKEIGWEMYGDAVAYSAKIPPGEDHLVIISRYPFDPSSQKITRDIHKVNSRVAQSIIIRDTPIGFVRLSNLHTHIDDPCTNMIKALKFFEQFDYQRTILGGDANITFSNFYGQPENLRRPDCKNYDWSKITNECTEFPYNCKPGDHACRNSSKCFGDYFYLPNPSDFKILTSWTIGNSYGISDQHPAVIAEIGSRVPIAPPFSIADINKDGIVNIFDYNLLLEAFGKAGAHGFDPADIIQNGTVDIYDFNALLQNFGK